MKNEKKSILFEEHLRKIKHHVDYKINESPRYRPLVGVDEEFDNLPLTNEAGEQEDAMKPAGGSVPPEPTNTDNPSVPSTPTPAFDQNAAPAPEDEMPPAGDVPMGDAPMPSPEPVEKVDDIQNEIIKHNIEAMKNIHDQLESLNQMTISLNDKLNVLTSDVEEVREPTNAEKLMNKTKVSYPYYFNLNDLWSDNWFSQQREKEAGKGIRELPDGTYIADFDDLPRKSKIDVQNSFNEV
jgi:hypothetical protein